MTPLEGQQHADRVGDLFHDALVMLGICRWCDWVVLAFLEDFVDRDLLPTTPTSGREHIDLAIGERADAAQSVVDEHEEGCGPPPSLSPEAVTAWLAR